MSQAGIINTSGGANPPIQTLTGNDAIAVPPTANNINVVGLGVVASGVSAAPNLYISGNAGTSTITIHDTQAQFLTNYTAVASSPYVVLATDYYISVDTSVARTIQLPNAPTTNRIFVIKDRTGGAAANSITVTTVGGAVTIDGAVSYTMNVNFAAIQLAWNGVSYEIF